MTIPNVLIGDAVNLTNGNTAGLTISTSLGGTGTLTQGADAILNIGAAGTFILSNLDASASGNTVNYNGSAQTVKPTTYHHLSLSNSGSKNISGLTTGQWQPVSQRIGKCHNCCKSHGRREFVRRQRHILDGRRL